jgi:head-tail adaptor
MLARARRNMKVRFERRTLVNPDAPRDYGNTQSSWAAVCEVYAHLRPRFGREQLEAGRLESTIEGVLTVDRTTLTRTLTADDRAVAITGAYAGKVFNLRSVIPTPNNAEFEILIEEGVAT